MTFMGYETIPLIIQNQDNIKFNIHYYNNIYLPQIIPSERPEELSFISSEEITQINIWCAHSIMMYINDNNIIPNNNTPDYQGILTNQSAIDTEVKSSPRSSNSSRTNPFELCFSLRDLPWDQEWKKRSDHMWIGDSGASCHFTNDDTSFVKWKPIQEPVVIPDGKEAFATK
jgi:hypothetical protein